MKYQTICAAGTVLLFLQAIILNQGASAQPNVSPAGTVDFNYDQVDVRILARTVAMTTGKRFVVDETVTGKVTVVTPEEIRLDELYPLFLKVLESSGYSVVETDGLHRIVEMPTMQIPSGPVISGGEVLSVGGVQTRVIKLHHLPAMEVQKVLLSMVRGADQGALRVLPSTNHLIVTDSADSLRRIEQLVEILDREGVSRKMEVVVLEHGNAGDIGTQLLTAMRGAESAGNAYSRRVQQITEGTGSLPAGVTVVASPEANRIIVVGTPIQLDEAKRIIAALDVEGPSGSGRLHAVFLKYLGAKEAAANLNALLAKTAGENQNQRIAIEANLTNNSLIIDATPRDFQLVKDLIKQLDRVPQQVMVEIFIAEIAVGSNFNFGVELGSIEEPMDGSTRVVGRSRLGENDTIMDLVTKGVFPGGLSVGVTHGKPVMFNGVTFPTIPLLLTALSRDRNVKILSNIPLWAQNNKEASVSVVDEIPILTSTIEGGSGTTRDIRQNIERVDVGIELKFTPQVNPDREVYMELNPSIETIVDEGSPDQPFTPTIARREVKTAVTVPDAETIIISGLMRDDVITTVSQVPFLGRIPVLGRIFQKSVDRKQRTNLLIFVTPHIVTDLDAAKKLQRDLESQASLTNATMFVDE